MNTGKYELVAKSKCSPEQCYDAWEKIVMENDKRSGGNDLDHQMQVVKSYCKLITDYMTITSNLMQLLVYVDSSLISELSKHGYKIDTSDNVKYVQSINAGLNRVKSFLSKIQMKENEMASMMKAAGGANNLSFSELVANLSFSLGSVNVSVAISNDITLAMYNEYRNLVKKKIEIQKRVTNGR